MSSGKAGRTNYSEWSKKTNSLLSELEVEEAKEEASSRAALGHGKYANSSAEASERRKAEEAKKAKDVLEGYRKREFSGIQVLTDLLSKSKSIANDVGSNDSDAKSLSMSTSCDDRYIITRKDMEAGKRVLTISDTTGPGTIVLSQDLTLIESKMASNTTLSPKSYHADAENDVAPEQETKTIHGLIKVHLAKLNNLTIVLRCKIISGMLELSHCSNIIVKIEKEATVLTVQADLCQDLNLQFHDAPSSKNIPNIHGNGSTATTTVFWGDDKDDRIFHAGVSNLRTQIYRDGYLEMERVSDYIKDGAVEVGNATKEEVQFVTSVVDGDLVTEKVLRGDSASSGGEGIGGDIGGSARAMTAREMKEIEARKELIRKAVDERLGENNSEGIKILNKDGEQVPASKATMSTISTMSEKVVEEEIYSGMSSDQISSIVKVCEENKQKGNEAFVAGEYAQAVLLYTLALDKAAELPDSSLFHVKVAPKSNVESDSTDSISTPLTTPKKQLFPRHIVLSNRSACFLKLGHHDKALADGIEAERLDNTYVKGVFRKGLALHAMGRYQDAVTSLAAAYKIEPKNKQIKQALQFAEVRLQKEMRKRMGQD